MKGFTLLEVMLALAIMAGVLLTVIGAVNYHLSLVERDRQETIALLLARPLMEAPVGSGEPPDRGNFAPQWPDVSWKAERFPTELSGVRRRVLSVTWGDRKVLSLVRYEAR